MVRGQGTNWQDSYSPSSTSKVCPFIIHINLFTLGDRRMSEENLEQTSTSSGKRGLLFGVAAVVGTLGAGIAYLLIRARVTQPRSELIKQAKMKIYASESRAQRFPVIERMLEKKLFKGIDLPDADLSGAYLRDADLRQANLSGSNLSDATLAMAKFKGANLEGVRFTSADLSYADFKGAKGLTSQQLAAAKSLEGAILPDGTELPRKRGLFSLGKSGWRTAFKQWASEQSA